MHEKKINGKKYACKELNVIEAIALYADIARIASRATGKIAYLLAAIVESEGTDDTLATDLAAASALSDILEKTPTQTLTDLIERVLQTVEVQRDDGFNELIPELDFANDKKSLVPVLVFALEVQFSDFFTGRKGNGAIKMLTQYLAKKK